MVGAVETIITSLRRSLAAAPPSLLAASGTAAVLPSPTAAAAAARPRSNAAAGGQVRRESDRTLLPPPTGGGGSDGRRQSQLDGLSEFGDLPEGASVNGDYPPTESAAGLQQQKQRHPGAAFASGTPAQCATLQRRLLGALAMLLVDQCCRGPCVQLDPGFDTLLSLLRDDEDKELGQHRRHGLGSGEAAGSRREGTAAAAWRRQRRVGAARVLTGMLQRSHGARSSLVASGALQRVFNLLNRTGEVR